MINNTDCAAGVQNCYVDMDRHYTSGMPHPPYKITDQPSYTPPIPWCPTFNYETASTTPEQPKADEDEDNHLADLASMIHNLVRLEIEDLKKGLVREVITELGKEIRKQGSFSKA